MFTSVFLLNIVYFSVCLTSNKLYRIEDQLADVSTRFFTSASCRRQVGVGELVRRQVDRNSIAWPTVELLNFTVVNGENCIIF